MRRVSELLASLKAALALGNHGNSCWALECAGRLPAPDAFRAAIQLEQARVDRNDHVFSLVVFEIGNPVRKSQGRLKTEADILKSLIQSLNDRVRSTDEIGWFDNHRIGVLLPYTSIDGAQKFVDDINRSIEANAIGIGSPPEYTIYSYPSNWHFNNGNSGHSLRGQLYFTDISNRWDTGFVSKASVRPCLGQDCLQSECGTCSTLKPSTRSPLPIWKRLMDVVGSSFGIALTSPFLIIHTVILKIVSPGPVFFQQQRIGYSGRPFTMWKLRTMDVSVDTSVHKEHVSRLINGANKKDAEKPMVKLENHPHIIPGGKILRKMCIDELPQLINVLRGEMSLVGPRPPLMYEVEEFLDWQHRRFDAIPGMTGLWQVSGKNRLSFSNMIRLDIQYSRRKSLWLDLIILLKTPLAIVSQIRDSLVLQRKQRLIAEGKHV